MIFPLGPARTMTRLRIPSRRSLSVREVPAAPGPVDRRRRVRLGAALSEVSTAELPAARSPGASPRIFGSVTSTDRIKWDVTVISS